MKHLAYLIALTVVTAIGCGYCGDHAMPSMQGALGWLSAFFAVCTVGAAFFNAME